MDTVKFDTVARHFGHSMTRRQALQGLVAAAAVAAGGAIHSGQAASPQLRRRRKHRKHSERQDWCGRQGEGCGALDGDTGEYSAPYCCHGYECVYSTSNGSSSWTCQVRP